MEQNMTGMTYKLQEMARRIRELREITGLTTEEMARGQDNLAAHGNRVDYILTHMPSLKSRARLDTRASADAVSIYLASLEDAITCRRWFFGCLHMDKTLSAQRRAVFRDIIPIED